MAQIKSLNGKLEKFFVSDKKDSKGRTKGFVVVTDTAILADHVEDGLAEINKPVGTYYRVRVQCTRDGAAYGATQPYKWFDSEGERQRYISKAVSK